VKDLSFLNPCRRSKISECIDKILRKPDGERRAKKTQKYFSAKIGTALLQQPNNTPEAMAERGKFGDRKRKPRKIGSHRRTKSDQEKF
jgi:hypothetical protein